MIKLPIYFISDNHFSMSQSEMEQKRRSKLFKLFDKIESTNGTLVIGGDFFDFWFDYNDGNPQEYNDIFLRLNQLNKSGIKIHYILGNHDYWDFGSLSKNFGAIVHDGDLEIEYDNKKILITHGDGLLKNDHSYRIMKKIIRSKICIFFFKLLKSKIGYGIANKVSKTSSHYHHHDQRAAKIRMEMKSFAKKKWNEGYDTILIGHYHQTGIEVYNGKRLIFMGDWLKHFTVTSLDKNGWHQNKWD